MNKQFFDPVALYNLDGHVALVTGGGSGLGRQFAQVLAEAGAAVAVSGRRLGPLQETAALIEQAGGKAVAVSMDVMQMGSIQMAFSHIEESIGLPDILLNNAGANRPKFANDITPEDWDAVLDTNLKGCFFVAQEFAKRLIAAGKGGSVVNIASVIGLRTQKAISAYMAAKAGLLHLTRGQALEWANYGIRVNALAPGYFRTELTGKFLDTPAGQKLISSSPMKRGGNLEELNAAMMLLASAAGSFMTGSTVVVDGGHSISSL
ncbi:MAG: SDR family oxidoreductase [Xanthomonadales bacterium]|nr:SDR family oxidoreductase [Xanthomonadales bacterium]